MEIERMIELENMLENNEMYLDITYDDYLYIERARKKNNKV